MKTKNPPGYNPVITPDELPYYLKTPAGKEYLEQISRMTGLGIREAEKLVYTLFGKNSKPSRDQNRF
ncbi:MAG: hypothetical protein DRP12_00400 [Candidatus Aenigmatarchaeota archaeon]|nr:MAG: hypothetical protein DRP12_00400 [Candidatus Aenigmarchaeota archaeon]